MPLLKVIGVTIFITVVMLSILKPDRLFSLGYIFSMADPQNLFT